MRLMLAGLLALLCASAGADTIIMKDGKRREGEVLPTSTEQYLMIRDPLVGEYRLDRSLVQEVIRSETQRVSADVAVQQAKNHYEGRRFEDALSVLVSAHETDPGRPEVLSPDFTRMFTGVLESAQRAAQQGALDQSRELYNVLYNTLTKPAAQELLGRDYFQSYLQSVRRDYARVSAQLASNSAQQPGLRRQAQFYLDEAVRLDPTVPQYQFDLAQIAFENRDYPTAYQSFESVARNAAAPQDLRQRANDRMSQLRAQVGGGTTGVPAATPAPPPPPLATPVTVTAIPTPVPQGDSQPAATESPGWSWNRIQSIIISMNVRELGAGAVALFTNPDYVPWLVGVPLVFLLLGYAPFAFLRGRARKGDIIAAQYWPLAQKTGIVALVPYLMTVAKRPAIKNRCPFCNKSLDNLEEYKDLNFLICPHCQENITPIYNLKDYLEHLVKQLEMKAKQSRDLSTESPIERDAMLKLVRSLLTMAVRRRATDLHLDAELEGTKVRARIDGMMYDLMHISKLVSNPLVSAIKIMANLDISEKRIPQDGKVSTWIDKNDLDLRINTSPAAMGEKVSIRILNQKMIQLDPTRLGLDGENLEKYERAIRKPNGLIFVTGPSGSGKSTTLYVALNEINTGDKNMVTIEDPIEYQVKGLNQMQVNTATNFTFATALRSILRQDPDVILVGEIRDKETADIAVEAALTGHLVFTTLHTIDAPSAFGRLADLGVDPRRVATAVIAVVAQRLIRTICDECKRAYKPKRQDLEYLDLLNKEIAYVHGAGCDNCLNTGYYGRIAIYEFLQMDETLREVLETNPSTSVIRELARKSGYRTLREEGLLKVEQGLTTVEEVIRVTS